MPSDRREFIRQAATLAAGLAATPARAAAQPRTTAMPTPRARALMDALGLKYPIFNAGMGTLASPQLAAAVSEGGGLGIAGFTNLTPDVVRERMTMLTSATKRPFAINYLIARQPNLDTLSLVLDLGAPMIQFAWGIPSTEAVATIRRARAKYCVQVASAAGARQALDLGADLLICQGNEAGGHVQATTPLYDALPRVIDEAKTTPVLAAGGIADGRAIRRALVAGASGVLIGTRFVATTEAWAHTDYKHALTRAKASDQVLTVCFQDGWVNAPHGVLRNRTFEMWEAAGCPPPGRRPGEGDVVARNAAGNPIIRYASTLPGPLTTGTIGEMVHYAGRGVDAIRDVPSATELVQRLWRECVEATG